MADIGELIYLFFFNVTPTTDIYTLSLHDALPILYFDSLTVNAGNGGFLHCIQMDTSECNEENHHYQRSEERFSRNAETDLVCRLLLEKKKGDADRRRRGEPPRRCPDRGRAPATTR